MQSLFDIINKERSVNQIKSERADVIRQFVEEINRERTGTKYKQLSPKAIAIKLSHLDLGSLYTFLSLCKDYKNRQGAFGKYFFGALKVK